MTANLPIVTLQQVIDIAQQKGFTLEQAQVAAAVAHSEGTGINGTRTIIGDNGTSFGPFQFHIGGQLNNFQSWLSTLFGSPVTLQQAATTANTNQGLAVEYALDHYLGDAIRRGTALGLHGADLARYVSQFGQVSAFPQNADNAYSSLFGVSDGVLVTPEPGSAGDITTPTTSQEPSITSALGQVTGTGAGVPPSQDIRLFSTPFGSINIPSGLILVIWGAVLLILGALLAFVNFEKPSVTVKTMNRKVGNT